MSIPSKDKEWKRKDLEKRGFYYNDNSPPPTIKFSPHVEALRQAMLDFTCGEDYDSEVTVC